MNSLRETTAHGDVLYSERIYGVHDYSDQYGNEGTKISSQCDTKVSASLVSGLFDTGKQQAGIGLTHLFHPTTATSKKRIFVAVDAQCPGERRTQIEKYFSWCKIEGLLEDYTIMSIKVSDAEKTLLKVELVVQAAEQFGLKRRDLFVAIGSITVADIVGFAAAIYRRSTRWIFIPNDLASIARGAAGHNRLSLHHISHDASVHRDKLALFHPPMASFYDLSSLAFASKGQIRSGLIEIINVSLGRNGELFTYVEDHIDKMLASPRQAVYLANAVGLAAKSATEELTKDQYWSGNYGSLLEFGVEATRSIRIIKGIVSDDADSVALAVGLMTALSALKGYLQTADFGRVLSVLTKAELPIYDESLDANALWHHMVGMMQERGEPFAFLIPVSLGQSGILDVAEVSIEDIRTALSVLREHSSAKSGRSPGWEIITADNSPTIYSNEKHENTVSEDVQYHVISVPQLFHSSNPTLMQNYCVNSATGQRRKVLVFVDALLDSTIAAVESYFESHSSANGDHRIIPMHYTSYRKDMDAVLKIIDAAIELAMSQEDLIIVVGGGTLMDIVGFAAAMYKGGISYIRVPTTLVGMIDAGVGAKVGVNFKNYKSLIGRYFAPVSCLNDSRTFLATLPRREFACGLAEAIKVALIKSPRLFEVIEKYHRNVEYNTHTEELIRISIRMMLEELQPNLREESLCRLVDFGHEFGHIVEALARYERPHGECVAIGMAISSFLAHSRRILSRENLERILNCILDLELPIYATDYDCCNPDVLWAKISTSGIQHKDGMLYLAVPESIGKGSFIDNISDISAHMVTEAVLSLRKYADRYAEKSRRVSRNIISYDAGNLPRLNGSRPLSGGSESSSTDNRTLFPGDHSLSDELGPRPTTAAIIGASGDIGSQLAMYLLENGMRVICLVRPASLAKFEKRTNPSHPKMKVIVGDMDLANLRQIIQEVDVIYNMAGAVTLSSKPDAFRGVIWLNGFIQGIIVHLIQHMRRERDVKVIYPSTQRVHLIMANASVDAWLGEAAATFFSHKDTIVAAKDVFTALQKFSTEFMASHPLPTGFNVYEISKRLGECFVSHLPLHSVVRISSVYGPTFDRGFIYRAIHAKPEGNVEAPEKRDFIYIDDVNKLLFEAAHLHGTDGRTFDGASGESIDLEKVWGMIRDLMGDHAVVTFKTGVTQEEMNPNPCFALRLLGRDFVPIHLGLRKTIEKSTKTIQERVAALSPRWGKPYVIVVDVGATYLRFGITSPLGQLIGDTKRIATPSKQSHPQDKPPKLQERLLEAIIQGIRLVRAEYADISLEEVGISFGAVITCEGVIEDASILWNDRCRGYDFRSSLLERLPDVRLTILNDISAAAWRYKDEGRFCLITVSSGLSNKVFNPDLDVLNKLDIGTAGIGGEMGHVTVEPRAVDALVQRAISQAISHPEEFQCSVLATLVNRDVTKINARYLGMAAREQDNFALRLLEEADIPYCACGSLADLCSYSSGRAAILRARSLASRVNYNVRPEDITDGWLQQAIAAGHPLGLKVLHDSTYPLALRILQLAADIGLDKFIIVGGFALRTAKGAYLASLQDQLVSFNPQSAFFSGWGDSRFRQLVRLGVDDNDGLVGMGYFVQHLRAHYLAVEKPVREQSLAIATRRIPRCGAQEILAKVLYSGICTTDLQILRGERGLEPVVLGHEGVCQIVEVGKEVKGLRVGEMIVINPNNPLDDHDKLGHTREGLFQEYVKFGADHLERKQILILGDPSISATDTLVEPLSCVVAAQERIKERIPGHNVLVVGAGFMGLLFALMNAKMGARNVFLANRSQQGLDFAITKGIVPEEKAFTIGGDHVSSRVGEISGGEGVDIVIICVSLGQGVHAAHDAMRYVNHGGCVYLFAGFRPGDVLAVDGGTELDAWSVRTGWKTEQVLAHGKTMDISGHRGSRREDLAAAADLIRHNRLSFSRVISHIISLDHVPESMLSLARDGTIQGLSAKRVVVDMEAGQSSIVRAEELPLRHLCEAARKPKDTIPMGNIFRNIGFDGKCSFLGWVHPPLWQDIEVALSSALDLRSLGGKQHFVWVGTGAWGFLIDALHKMLPASPDVTFHILQSLDPQALVNLFSDLADLSSAVCIGISQSGNTLETVRLMNALKERFESSGLDYRQHFVWLTDVRESPVTGKNVIRSSRGQAWMDVDMLSLTVLSHADINALLCAPHSMVTFLPLVILLGKDSAAVRDLYQQYLEFRDEVLSGILPKADFIVATHVEHIQLNLDASIAPAIVELVTQLVEQALGSKEVGFNPRVRVASAGDAVADGFECLTLPIPTKTPTVVRAMLTMYALSVFVATIAYSRRIEFVTHDKVDLYKHRAAELMTAPTVEEKVSEAGSISGEVITYLKSNPQARFVEVLLYGNVPAPYRQKLTERIGFGCASVSSNISVEVQRGEEWNHSRYQAAVQREDTLYAIIVLQEYRLDVEGISVETVCGNVRVLEAIARATYDTLLPRALYFRLKK
ncbi:putative 3-dehydroquinate synthase [Seiridium cardinale]